LLDNLLGIYTSLEHTSFRGNTTNYTQLALVLRVVSQVLRLSAENIVVLYVPRFKNKSDELNVLIIRYELHRTSTFYTFRCIV
jgi:hypothetical protein